MRYSRGLPHQLIHRLAELAPRLQPELLHRVISVYGLEDCTELVAQATPAQLSHVFDLDLWRPARPGLDEQFDAERFGVWIEVLVEAGADLAAEKLSQMPLEQLIAGFAHHARVFDIAAIAAYDTIDGERIESRAADDELTCEIGGYHLAARREDAWDAIVTVLLSLDARHRGRFDELMSALRSLSNSTRELDGLARAARERRTDDVRRRKRARAAAQEAGIRVTGRRSRISADVAECPARRCSSAESTRTRVLSLDRHFAGA